MRIQFLATCIIFVLYASAAVHSEEQPNTANDNTNGKPATTKNADNIFKKKIEFSWYLGYARGRSMNTDYGTPVMLNSWVPLHLIITNNEKKAQTLFEGTLTARVYDGRGSNRYYTDYSKHVALAGAGSKKHIIMQIYLPDSIAFGSGSLKVSLNSKTHNLGFMPGIETTLRTRIEYLPNMQAFRDQYVILSKDSLTLPVPYTGSGNVKSSRTRISTNAEIDSLPRKWLGYSGISGIIWNGMDISKLPEKEQSAITNYVKSGGKLIVFTGANSAKIKSSFLDKIIPCTIGGNSTVDLGSELLFAKGRPSALVSKLAPKPGARITRSSNSGMPLIVEKDMGAGTIKVVAFALNESFQRRQQGDSPVERQVAKAAAICWTRDWMDYILESGPHPLRDQYQMNIRPFAFSFLSAASSKKIPGRKTMFLFLLTYIIVLIPLNFLIFKKRQRVEFAWFATPLVAIAFGYGSYIAAFSDEAESLAINDVTVARMSEDGTCGVFDFSLQYNPSYASYDIGFNKKSDLSPIYLRADRLPGLPGNKEYQHTYDNNVPNGMKLINQYIKNNNHRVFEASGSLKIGEGITIRIDDSLLEGKVPKDRTIGIVSNRTGQTIQNSAIIIANKAFMLEDIASGDNMPLKISEQMKNLISIDNMIITLSQKHVNYGGRDLSSQFIPLFKNALAITSNFENRPMLVGIINRSFIPWTVYDKPANPMGMTIFTLPCRADVKTKGTTIFAPKFNESNNFFDEDEEVLYKDFGDL